MQLSIAKKSSALSTPRKPTMLFSLGYSLVKALLKRSGLQEGVQKIAILLYIQNNLLSNTFSVERGEGVNRAFTGRSTYILFRQVKQPLDTMVEAVLRLRSQKHTEVNSPQLSTL